MSRQQSAVDEVSEKEIVEYLRRHPDFFTAHGQLLAELAVPHGSGDAASLIERQVVVLRDQNRQLRRELTDLVQIARDNDRLNERVQRLTLTLLDTNTLSDILLILHDTLHNDYNADAVAFRLFIPAQDVTAQCGESVNAAFVDAGAENLAAFKKILDGRLPACGRFTDAQLQYLFEGQAGGILSAVVLPLSGAGASLENAPSLGLLAIGSHDSERFHSDMGTVFLSYMGAIISCVLNRHLIKG